MYPVPDHANKGTYMMQGAELNPPLTAMFFDPIETMNSDGSPEFVVDPGLYYRTAANYGYYCTGIESPSEWDDHHRFFGVDGVNIHDAGVRTESSPYAYYAPSYGYGESPYNPYNAYTPGAMIGVDGSYAGSQTYYTIPSYQNAASSPGYFPVVIGGSSSNPLLDTGPIAANRVVASGARQTLSPASAIFSQYPSKPPSSHAYLLTKTSEGSRTNSGTNKIPVTHHCSASGSLSHGASSVFLQGGDGSVLHQDTDNISHRQFHPQQNRLKLSLPVGSVLPNFASSTNSRAVADSSWSRFYHRRFSNDANEIPFLLGEQNRGPRTNRSINQFVVKAYTTKAGESDSQGNIVISADQYNKDDFPDNYVNAKFFVIKSYSEDDVHKSIKYSVWSSTPNGNKKLNSAFEDAQQIAAGKPGGCPIFLFFSVNASGQFCGLAEMAGAVDFLKDMDFWQQDKWSGSFSVKWHIIKDVPNTNFRHIILENNEHKPVSNSRDTQEITSKKGMEMMKIFKNYMAKTSLLDDFMYYERREKYTQDERSRKANVLLFESFGKLGSLVNLPTKVDEKITDNLSSTEKLTKSSIEPAPSNNDGDISSNKVAKNTTEVNDNNSARTLNIGSLTINPNQAEYKSSRTSPSSVVVGTIPIDREKTGPLKKDSLPK
ncbi:hypothetical protein Nepgr_020089 [Nepenthes gracilis]|uniref:YTH domain-containing family protein n=1 Tax=Nepenthes gracilis TaxID=150966 RepID=A0AAD3SVC1_NEPGR|nr:hypothetical protein Nepgr_020089 [Nepenthes gracilis]